MPTLIQQDCYRKTGKYSNIFYWNVCFDPGLKFLYWLRKAQRLQPKARSEFLTGWCWEGIRSNTVFKFQPKPRSAADFISVIGERWLSIRKPKSEKLQSGAWCHHRSDQQRRKSGVPEIGDDVWIGTNAVIVGGVKIGNNVLIAPNTYVNQDVESDSIAVGNPMTIIKNEKATEGYLNNKVWVIGKRIVCDFARLRTVLGNPRQIWFWYIRSECARRLESDPKAARTVWQIRNSCNFATVGCMFSENHEDLKITFPNKNRPTQIQIFRHSTVIPMIRFIMIQNIISEKSWSSWSKKKVSMKSAVILFRIITVWNPDRQKLSLRLILMRQLKLQNQTESNWKLWFFRDIKSIPNI